MQMNTSDKELLIFVAMFSFVIVFALIMVDRIDVATDRRVASARASLDHQAVHDLSRELSACQERVGIFRPTRNDLICPLGHMIVNDTPEGLRAACLLDDRDGPSLLIEDPRHQIHVFQLYSEPAR